LCKSIGVIVYQGLYFPSDIGRDCAKCVCVSVLLFFSERSETFFDGLTAVRHSVCAAVKIQSDSNTVEGF